jgi:hypothetical protein
VAACVDFTTNGVLNVKVLRDCISCRGANISINAISSHLCENGLKKCQLLARKKTSYSSFCPILANYFQKTFSSFLRWLTIQKTDYQKIK